MNTLESASIIENPRHHDDSYTLAVIQDPLALLSGVVGPLKLHLEVNAKNGRIFLCLSSDKTNLLQVRVDKLLKLKKKISSSKEPDTTCSKSSKKKRKRKRTKPSQDGPADRYDWAKHEFEVLLKEFKVNDINSNQSVDKATRKRKRKRKRKKKKKKKDKRKTREKSGKSVTNKRKHKEKAQRKNDKNKYGKQDLETASSSDTRNEKGVAAGQRTESTSSDSQEHRALSPSTVSTPKRSNSFAATGRASNRSSVSDASSFSMADLRSPLTWERRRQALLQQSKQPGSAKISAISLSDPFQTASGYFLSTGTTTQAKLDETLKGGAFVYKSSRRESKMIKWQKRLSRQFLPANTLFVDPASSPSCSLSSTESPLAPPKLARGSTEETEEYNIKHQEVDGSSWIEFEPDVASDGGAVLFRGTLW